MKKLSVNAESFKLYLKGTTAPVSAAVSYAPKSKKAILNPEADLEPGKTYKAVVTTRVKDRAGNRLAANEVWSFTVRP